MEELVELTSGFVDRLLSARISFGLETDPQTRFELIHSVAAVLSALNHGRDATAERTRLHEITTAHITEIQAAWQRTIEGGV